MAIIIPGFYGTNVYPPNRTGISEGDIAADEARAEEEIGPGAMFPWFFAPRRRVNHEEMSGKIYENL